MDSLIDAHEKYIDINVPLSDLHLFEERIKETIDEIEHAIKTGQVDDDVKGMIKQVLFCAEYSDLSEKRAEYYERLLEE